MIINNKFVTPKEFPNIPSIRKDYRYFHVMDNLWNHKYFSSPKISQFYHKIQEEFNSGPYSPERMAKLQAELESFERSQKTVEQKLQSRQRLMKRKAERELIQIHSKQKSEDPELFVESLDGKDLNMPIRKRLNSQESHRPRVPVNEWERVGHLSPAKLKSAYPNKLLEKDSQGFENILNKTEELQKLEDYFEEQKQQKRQKLRNKLAQWHNDSLNLERKSGIVKYRLNEIPESTVEDFNTSLTSKKPYTASKRLEELSRPRIKKLEKLLEHHDFRGLLKVDFPNALSKINSSFGSADVSLISSSYKTKRSSSISVDESKTTLYEISDFEKKNLQKANLDSPLEITVIPYSRNDPKSP
ncbi:unnamed protein product [Blepharisma stoltei]|uniref:Uncharacterized protein n=1 Tax=Blepharisma stoltei TaxID=1481888 RepID=A0AAU9J4G9_9CILI|nr:unnamed protein product [Blepharisma stoltei]